MVLDSVGIGGAADAARYGDEGADTLGHIAEACADGLGDRSGLRSGPLRLPNLVAIGLGQACRASTGRCPPGLEGEAQACGFGHAAERSRGKDTPSGHWELAGCPVDREWHVFPRTEPCLPPGLVAALIREANLPGVLGQVHASGTAILDRLGAESFSSGRPILYTSADSVLQIAAHKTEFGLDRLIGLCRIARRLVDPLPVGRVIARPFRGPPEGPFLRTADRQDFAVPPPGPTLLDRLAEAGRPVVSVGKIGDIFAHRSTGTELKGSSTEELVERSRQAFSDLPDGGLVFTNLVDFDAVHGHRRDVPGYAAALEAFDALVPGLRAGLRPGDRLVLTADHGCDPTWAGTDHTREHVPVLVAGPEVRPGPMGELESFADVGASLARHLGVPGTGFGRPVF